MWIPVIILYVIGYSTRRKTFRNIEENQQTQPTYDAEFGN